MDSSKLVGASAPVLIAALVATAVTMGPIVTAEQTYVGVALSLIFRFGASILVAYISAKSYLMSGSRTSLVVGSGLLAFGLSGITGTLSGYFLAGPSAQVTVNNTGAMVAGILNVVAALMSAIVTQSASRRRLWLGTAYVGIAVFTLVLAGAAVVGVLPAYLIPGKGPTILGSTILASSVVLFSASFLFFMRGYLASKSGVLYWYSLALALLAIASSAFFFSKAPGDIVSWSGRVANALGCTFFVVAVLTTTRDRKQKR